MKKCVIEYLINYLTQTKNNHSHNNPPSRRRRSDISFRSHIGRDVEDHAETSSRRCNWYVNETDLFETSLRRLIDT